MKGKLHNGDNQSQKKPLKDKRLKCTHEHQANVWYFIYLADYNANPSFYL